MKKEQFEKCLPMLLQEYERSKGKHADFDSVDRAWRAIQREYCEVMNEILRDMIKDEALAMEMLHLSNVALQGYMFLMEDEKENRAMNKEWWDGVIEACQAMRDGKEAQINYNGDSKNWNDYAPIKDRKKLIFTICCKYRAKPESKLRPLTPQEWLEALLAGKTIRGEKFGLEFHRRGLVIVFEDCDGNTHWLTPKEILDEGKFSDGSPCGVEVKE